MKRKLTEVDFDSVGLVERGSELVGKPVREADVAEATAWIQHNARRPSKAGATRPVPQSTGAFAVAALRLGYRVVRESKGSHTVKTNMVLRKNRVPEESDWDGLIDAALQNDGRFTIAQADYYGITNQQLQVQVANGVFERTDRGKLRIVEGEAKTKAPVVHTHVRVTKEVHGMLLAKQKQLSMTVSAVIRAGLEALEEKAATPPE